MALHIYPGRGIDSPNGGPWFGNGYRVQITYGPLKDDGIGFPRATTFTGSHRRCILFDPDGNVITSVIEENPERIPKEIFELLYPGVSYG